MNRMKVGVAIPVLLIGLLSAAVVQAQVTKKQLDAVRANFKAPQDFYHKLSDEQRKMLSGGALNFFHAISAGSCSMTLPEILIHIAYGCAFVAVLMIVVALRGGSAQ